MKQSLEDMLDECNYEIEDIEARIKESPLDSGSKYLTYYALIKTCGTVEFVYRSIVADHFSQLANAKIDVYLETTIRQGSNSARYSNMKGMLKKFDTTWESNFQKAVHSNPNKKRMIDASNSLVTNRHAFAHGKNPTTSFKDIKTYYLDVVALIRIFDSVVL